MADYSNLVQFFTGSALPASPVANGIYFIVKDNVGTLYKGDVKIAETNDNVRIANIEQSIVDINTELAKKATKQELADHIELYEALLNVVQGHTTDIKAISDKVGTVPEGSTVMGIIKDIQDNAYDDTALRGEIEQSLNLKADKEQVAKDIAAAVKVEEEARIAAVSGVQGEVDALEELHAKDKKDLSDAIALKADQTALDAVSAVANAAVKQSDYDVKIKALEDEDARIVGLVEAEASKAREEEGKLNTRLEEVEAFFHLAEGEKLDEALDTLKELQDFVNGEGAAADQMILDIAKNAEDIKTNADAIDAVEGRLDTAEAKLAEIEASADVNVIEIVKVNGTALEVGEDKSVDISVPTGALASKNEVAEADLASALAEKINAKADQSALEEAVETLEQAIEDCGAEAEAKIDAALYVGEGESKVEKYALATALAAEVERAEGVESQLLAALTWQNA